MSIQDDKILKLIDSIYEAALNPQHWSDTLFQIGQTLNATYAMIIQDAKDKSIDMIISTPHDESLIKNYSEYFYQYEPWNEFLDNTPTGQIYAVHNINMDNYDNSEFYNDWAKNIGMYYVMGGYVENNGNKIAKIGFQRPKDKTYFSAEEEKFINILSPHIRRALEINQSFFKLNETNNATLNLLDNMEFGILYLNSKGHVVSMNHKADDILTRTNILNIVNNTLHCNEIKRTNILHGLIYNAIHTNYELKRSSGNTITLSTVKSKSSFELTIYSLNTKRNNLDINNHNVCAAILIRDSNTKKISLGELLKSIYSLTPAEIRIVKRIAEGENLINIAEEFQLADNTVRNQLKSCFAKTDTHSQVELIKLVHDLKN